MSKSFVFERFYLERDSRVPDAEGGLVDAQDAINREAVLQAQIRTLEVQLKDCARVIAESQERIKLYLEIMHSPRI